MQDTQYKCTTLQRQKQDGRGKEIHVCVRLYVWVCLRACACVCARMWARASNSETAHLGDKVLQLQDGLALSLAQGRGQGVDVEAECAQLATQLLASQGPEQA